MEVLAVFRVCVCVRCMSTSLAGSKGHPPGDLERGPALQLPADLGRARSQHPPQPWHLKVVEVLYIRQGPIPAPQAAKDGGEGGTGLGITLHASVQKEAQVTRTPVRNARHASSEYHSDHVHVVPDLIPIPKGCCAGEHFAEDHAEAIDVHRLCVSVAKNHLWGHIFRSAENPIVAPREALCGRCGCVRACVCVRLCVDGCLRGCACACVSERVRGWCGCW